MDLLGRQMEGAPDSSCMPLVSAGLHGDRLALELTMEPKAAIRIWELRMEMSFLGMFGLCHNLVESELATYFINYLAILESTYHAAVEVGIFPRRQTWKYGPSGNPPWPQGLPRNLLREEPQSLAMGRIRRVLWVYWWEYVRAAVYELVGKARSCLQTAAREENNSGCTDFKQTIS